MSLENAIISTIPILHRYKRPKRANMGKGELARARTSTQAEYRNDQIM